MDRYCFITTVPTWYDVTSKLYFGLDVSTSQLSADEGCITVNEEADYPKVVERNAQLEKTPGFSKPLPVPAWKKIVNNGPYIAEERFIPSNTVVRVGGKTSKLNSVGEQALHLFDHNAGPEYKKNFAIDFKRLTGIDFKSIDFSELSPLRTQQHTVSVERASVNVDGSIYYLKQMATDTELKSLIDNQSVTVGGYVRSLKSIATPATSVSAKGHIIPGVLKKDITLNSRTPVTGFATEYSPGASWAAKWPTGRLLISFPDDVDDDDESSGGETESNASVKSDDSVGWYASSSEESEPEEAENSFQPVKVKGVGWGPMANVPFNLGDAEQIVPDFDGLSESERKYLPLSYVISDVAQWRAVAMALTSNFNSVYELPKVNDGILGFVADAAYYSFLNGNKLSLAAIKLLQYAEMRRV